MVSFTGRGERLAVRWEGAGDQTWSRFSGRRPALPGGQSDPPGAPVPVRMEILGV